MYYTAMVLVDHTTTSLKQALAPFDAQQSFPLHIAQRRDEWLAQTRHDIALAVSVLGREAPETMLNQLSLSDDELALSTIQEEEYTYDEEQNRLDTRNPKAKWDHWSEVPRSDDRYGQLVLKSSLTVAKLLRSRDGSLLIPRRVCVAGEGEPEWHANENRWEFGSTREPSPEREWSATVLGLLDAHPYHVAHFVDLHI